MPNTRKSSAGRASRNTVAPRSTKMPRESGSSGASASSSSDAHAAAPVSEKRYEPPISTDEPAGTAGPPCAVPLPRGPPRSASSRPQSPGPRKCAAGRSPQAAPERRCRSPRGRLPADSVRSSRRAPGTGSAAAERSRSTRRSDPMDAQAVRQDRHDRFPQRSKRRVRSHQHQGGDRRSPQWPRVRRSTAPSQVSRLGGPSSRWCSRIWRSGWLGRTDRVDGPGAAATPPSGAHPRTT